MNTSLVLALIGPNTTGIVHRVAEIATAHDANWLSARMMNLAGQFAGIVHLELPQANAEGLKSALHEVERNGMHVLITSGDAALGGSADDHLRLDLVGSDHRGIVRDISGALAKLGVSIESLVTDRVSGAHSGDLLFHATAELRVPADVVTPQLRNALESLAHDLMVDLTLDTAARG
ncbi:MAG TPA: ACT domain-containing protein [Casimicrobiaceae bacterium]|nr:ACT domain-containing protein [Casimicrobiaceae bacterium]